jgi:hypothetical protein
MRISVAAILVLVLGLSSCAPEPKDAYSKVANTKVQLLPGFQSYESISAVSRKLGVQGSHAKVTEDSKLPPSDRRPRFDIYTIEVPDRAFCGQKGILRLLSFLTIGLRLPRSTPNDLSHAWSTFAGRESRYQTNRPRLEISSLGPARTPRGDRILHGKIGDFAKSRTGGSRNIRNGI